MKCRNGIRAYSHTIACIILLLLFYCTDSNAIQTIVKPEIKLGAQQDDNINVNAQKPISLNGVSLNAQLNVEVSTPTWTHSLQGGLTRYSFNRSEYDSEDQLIKLSAQQEGERHTISVAGNIVRDSTRTSEELDSGRITAGRREQYAINALWSYRLGERSSVSLSGTGSITDYQSDQYIGNRHGQAYAQWAYALTQKLQVFLRSNISGYGSDDQSGSFTFIQVIGLFPVVTQQQQSYTTDTVEYGLQLGTRYQWTEHLSLFALAGSNETKTYYDIDDSRGLCRNTAFNPTFIVRGVCYLPDQQASATTVQLESSWRHQRHSVTANYYMRNQPSSDGYLIKSERLSLNWNYPLSRLSDIRVSAVWGKHESLNQRRDVLDRSASTRDYYSLNVFFDYQLSENWVLNSSYKHRYQNREVSDSSAESNAVEVAIIYKPGKSLWSR